MDRRWPAVVGPAVDGQPNRVWETVSYVALWLGSLAGIGLCFAWGNG
jgi:hypothetical protein